MHPTAARVQQRLTERGLDVEVRVLPDSARTAAEAAGALGCEVGQIVKSLVFLRDEQPVMVLCAGDRRVAAGRLGLGTANAEQARAATSLRRFATVWCAAGTPHAVFEVDTEALIGAARGPVLDVS
jgi:prolyl-tRNA editing enzyme YbaK/EbsC (Cys-tRNA(Pro) deacylase)